MITNIVLTHYYALTVAVITNIVLTHYYALTVAVITNIVLTHYYALTVAVKEFVFAQAAVAGGSLQRHHIIEEIVGEAGVMACLRHPKILQLYGCTLTMQAIWIVSELCVRGSLRLLLNDRKVSIPLIKKISLCLDIADGMLYLHSKRPPLIHRDLKSHNVFVAEPTPGNFVAKIGDWGSARAVALSGTKSMTHGVGTACWLAPEVHELSSIVRLLIP